MTCRFYSDDNIIGSGFKLFKYCRDLFTALLVVSKRNAVSQSLAVSVNDYSLVLVFDDVDPAIKHCDTPRKNSYSKGYPLHFTETQF